MNPQRPNRGPGPQRKKPGHYYHHRPYYPYHWYWYNRDWDYDWDYDWDWNYWEDEYIAPQRRVAAPRKQEYYDDYFMYYQQGFRDGWKAAMDYLTYGADNCEPTPPPPEFPSSPLSKVQPIKPVEGESK